MTKVKPENNKRAGKKPKNKKRAGKKKIGNTNLINEMFKNKKYPNDSEINNLWIKLSEEDELYFFTKLTNRNFNNPNSQHFSKIYNLWEKLKQKSEFLKKKSDLQKVKLDHILDYICFKENSIRADELAFNASSLLENSDTLKNKFELWIKKDVNSYQYYNENNKKYLDFLAKQKKIEYVNLLNGYYKFLLLRNGR